MSTAARHLRAGAPRPDAPRPDERRQPAGPRHLEVVRRPVRSQAARRRRARVLVAAAIGALATVMFGLVYLHVVLAQRQIELDRMGTSLAAAQSRYQALRLQVAQLESPQQIISAAEGRLGMRPPASITYVTTPAGVPPAAVPATTAPGPTGAPSGDADWPVVKAELAGRP